jgi:acetyl esterase
MSFPMSAELAPEMQALMAKMLAEDGVQPDPTTLPAAEGRRLAEQGNRRWNRNLPPMLTATQVVVPAQPELGTPDFSMRVLVPEQPRPGAILFVHGGGFAFCSPATHERCGRVLAEASGLPVLLPDYRLAPEAPYPAGLADTVAALRLAFAVSADAGVEAGPLILAGDSAGANLALAAMLHEQRLGQAAATAALLFYGVYDADFDSSSYRFFAEGPGLTRGKMQRYWDFYRTDAGRRNDPLICPLAATDDELASLPPLHLMAAGVDPLLSDTLVLESRLAALGRGERTTVVPGVVHGFLQMTNELPQAREALVAAAAFTRRFS